MTTDTRPHVEYGDRTMALGNEILRSVVGSGLHGIAIEGTDDHDEMGIYIEPPDHVLGMVPDYREDFTFRTQPEGARSGPGDTDLVIYSLRKYLRLAIKGNPTALLPLYAPPNMLVVRTPLGDDLRGIRREFLSQDAVHRFLAYMQAQHDRMLGRGKRNRVPNRPELIEKYGYDTKYAAHALRLAYQGREVAFHRTLTLPLPWHYREQVLAVKTGEFAQDEVSREITRVALDVQEALGRDGIKLPRYADRQRISNWAVYAHRQHWGWR